VAGRLLTWASTKGPADETIALSEQQIMDQLAERLAGVCTDVESGFRNETQLHQWSYGFLIRAADRGFELFEAQESRFSEIRDQVPTEPGPDHPASQVVS